MRALDGVIAIVIGWLPLFFVGQTVYGQGVVEQKNLEHYVNLYSTSSGSTGVNAETLINFADKLSGKRKAGRSEKQFLEYVFAKTHQKFLKNYVEYTSFAALLETGKYNCLTGTALYALLLDHLGYPFKIVETNYHIFLIANTNEGDVLFEATDPTKGFVTSGTEIEKRIKSYKENSGQGNKKTYYRFSFQLYNSVNLNELLGLLHYNLAIEAFNAQDLSTVIYHLDRAASLYHSPRIEEFSRILLLSINEVDFRIENKEQFVKQILDLRKNKLQAIASAK